MLCIRRNPDDRPSLSKIRRLLHRITISFIDQQKRDIDRDIEHEFSSLFDETSQLGSPTMHLMPSPSPPHTPHTPQPPLSGRSVMSLGQERGRCLVVTDDMREEQEPATMCAVAAALMLLQLPLTSSPGKSSRDSRSSFPRLSTTLTEGQQLTRSHANCNRVAAGIVIRRQNNLNFFYIGMGGLEICFCLRVTFFVNYREQMN